jgi:hypothetical protein
MKNTSVAIQSHYFFRVVFFFTVALTLVAQLANHERSRAAEEGKSKNKI